VNIEKAIEILSQCVKTWEPTSQSEVKDAFMLGIEALKFRQMCVKRKIRFATFPLPGETKD